MRFLAGNHAASVFCEILFSGAFRRSTFSQPFVVGFCTRGQRMLPILHLRPIDGSNFGIATFTPIGFKRLGGRMRPNDASKSGQTMVQITTNVVNSCPCNSRHTPPWVPLESSVGQERKKEA